MTGAFTEDILIRIKAIMDKSVKQMGKKVASVARNIRGQMLGLGLSVMFMGMAMKRVFDQIWKSSSKTFQDVMHSVSGTITQFDLLEGSLKNVQFAIGSALEPVIARLIPVIDMLADWIDSNPKIAAGLVITLGILGTMLSVIGQVGLFVFAVAGAWPILAAAAGAAGAFIASVMAGLFAPITLLIIAVWAIIKAVLQNLKSLWDGVFVSLFNTFKSIWDDIKEIFVGFVMFFKGIFTGDWKLVWNGLVKIVLNSVSAMIKLLWGIGTALLNIAIFIVNVVKDTIFNVIGLVMEGILLLAKVVDKITGTSGTSGFVQNAIDNWEAIQDILTIPTISSEQSGQDNAAIEKLSNQIEVYVTLDGDEVADKTAQRIVDKTNASTS